MAFRIPLIPSNRLRLALGGIVVIVAVLVGLSRLPASADRPDPAPGWDTQHRHAWNGNRPPAPYGYGSHGYYSYRHPNSACGTNMVMGAAFGAGVGGLIGSQLSDRPNDAGATIMGMLIGAVLGGALGQSADRANGC
ncbi:MAG TPA: glycine zipper 2TM domain-containing protein [Stellaceae bacterium]|nr:glycine zipper 2TM domain-containing protein [Stellaceae bacterium]